MYIRAENVIICFLVYFEIEEPVGCKYRFAWMVTVYNSVIAHCHYLEILNH